MANYKKNWLAIVCAYRKEEDDLQATLESAAESAGKGAQIITVEDKDLTGPGYNRHRGIESAKDAEVIILIDAHMRFQGDVLRRMAKQVKKNGGLLVPFCHHNAECSFDTKTASGKHYYGGARIVWRAQDGAQKTALAAKWNREAKAGPCGAVMGACYAFRRDWYYKVGQPLSILRGWGCDEELLSICAWLSGKGPEVIDGHVAHRYRDKTPWPVTQAERDAVASNRARLINSFAAAGDADWHELTNWNNKAFATFKECSTLISALAKLPRKFSDWKREVCEPDEINGVQAAKEYAPATTTPKRQYIINPTVPRVGIRCGHCHFVSESHKVTNTYPNGNKRHKCESCGKPFVSIYVAPK